jgi:hypothetical protein
MSAGRAISFLLPFALDSLNVRDRKNHHQHGRDKKNIALEILAAIGGPAHKPFPPFNKVKVTVERCSAGSLDHDNLVGSTKNLLDALCVQSPRHPSGIGIIRDDSAIYLTLEVKQSRAPRGAGKTVVRIECLDEVEEGT